MTTQEAVANINLVLSTGRIDMPNGPLTAQEHIALGQSLTFLAEKAKQADMPDAKNAGPKEEAE